LVGALARRDQNIFMVVVLGDGGTKMTCNEEKK
jgi:hypothetical protein